MQGRVECEAVCAATTPEGDAGSSLPPRPHVCQGVPGSSRVPAGRLCSFPPPCQVCVSVMLGALFSGLQCCCLLSVVSLSENDLIFLTFFSFCFVIVSSFSFISFWFSLFFFYDTTSFFITL